MAEENEMKEKVEEMIQSEPEIYGLGGKNFHATYCNIQRLTVIEESDQYFIAKDANGRVEAIDKNHARVLVIEANCFIR